MTLATPYTASFVSLEEGSVMAGHDLRAFSRPCHVETAPFSKGGLTLVSQAAVAIQMLLLISERSRSDWKGVPLPRPQPEPPDDIVVICRLRLRRILMRDLSSGRADGVLAAIDRECHDAEVPKPTDIDRRRVAAAALRKGLYVKKGRGRDE